MSGHVVVDASVAIKWLVREEHTDKALAIATRTRFIDTYCDTETLILGTHFNTPTGVHIVSTGQDKRIRC